MTPWILLDLLIGDTSYLGKGFATPMIEQFIITQYNDADTFLIDPEQGNSKAIFVYKKAGFNTVETITPEYNPIPHTMMMLKVADLKIRLVEQTLR